MYRKPRPVVSARTSTRRFECFIYTYIRRERTTSLIIAIYPTAVLNVSLILMRDYLFIRRGSNDPRRIGTGENGFFSPILFLFFSLGPLNDNRCSFKHYVRERTFAAVHLSPDSDE